MIENEQISMNKKWTGASRNVHRNAQLNGQLESCQVVDLPRKVPCPSKANLRGKVEGTLPGKA